MISIKLSQTQISNDSPPYIIAEIGVNHQGSFEKAKELIDLANFGGANAVKFQSYKANKIAIKNSPSYWDLNSEPTTSQYKLFEKYDVFNEGHYVKLAEYSEKKKIDFISTPFDLDAVDYLNPIVSYFKISSSDINNVPLLRKIASKKKPIVLSTGASNIADIDFAITTITNINLNADIALLHCVLNYPVLKNDANLNLINVLKNKYPKHIIGYSDHTIPDEGMQICSTAYLLGARIIEKHFTDNKKLPGNDHYHSMDSQDLKVLVENLKYLRKIIGNKNEKNILEKENISAQNARRSIYANKKIYKGEILKEDMLICKRPNKWVSASNWDSLIGKRVLKDINYDDPITFDLITNDDL